MPFPNDEQKIVIDQTGRPLIVVAGPGTGKTNTIVARMEKLLKENPNRDVSFITFTRTSRKDTERKVTKVVGEDALAKAEFEFPRISTLHTYAVSIVRRYALIVERNSRFSILIDDHGERNLVLTELICDLKLDTNVVELQKETIYYRNTGILSETCPYSKDDMNDIMKYFELLLKFYNTYEMEGVVSAACEILSSKKVIIPPVYLQVDEYQDLNPIDQKLVKLISSDQNSLIVAVGDDAQSIYGFRNANPEGIKELWNSHDWEHIQFKKCHRLPPHILRASQALISGLDYLGNCAEVPDYKEKKEKIDVLQCTTSDYQIDAVAKLITLIKESKKNKDGETLINKDFMILCPNTKFAKKVSSTLEEEYKIPAKTKEKTTIPNDHWRLLLVLRMYYNQDSLALRQWLDIINVDSEDIKEYRLKALERKISLYEYCKDLKVELIKEIYVHLDKLRKAVDDFDLFKKELLDFPNLLIEDTLFPEIGITLNEVTKAPNSIGTVIRLIHEKFGLLDKEEEISEEDKVLVTTFYSAKGLEAEFVFIMWLNKIFMPALGRDADEERRVLYVALTRAKQDVFITFHETFLNNRRVKREAMSPFLAEIPDEIDIVRITKKNLKELILTND